MRQSMYRGMVIAAASIMAVIGSAIAQPTATDLSYHPLHLGNVWLYRIYQLTPQGEQPYGWREDRIVADTLMPNGERYFVYNNGNHVRMDSTTGQVFRYRNDYHPKTCLDTNETEVMNVSVHADTLYQRCGEDFGFWGWEVSSLPSDVIGELNVDIKRPRRCWLETFFADDLRYAEGIGLYYFSGTHFGDKVYYLSHAHINGVDYWPVTFRSFTAAALPGGAVHLRWRTENEVQNAGFTVQRREADHVETWDDLAFVPGHAGEGEGASYEYTDHATTSRADAVWQYRLRQMDYDGTVAFSDIVTVYVHNIPAAMSLTVWPNPASASVSIQLGLDGDGPALLLVTDMLGREVRRFGNIANDTLTTWDLRDAAGYRVPAGMYHVTALRGDRRVRSMLLVMGM